MTREVRLDGGKYGKWPSDHGQLTKIRVSEGYEGKTITTAAQIGYGSHGFEGYLGNVGLHGHNTRVSADSPMYRIARQQTIGTVPIPSFFV